MVCFIKMLVVDDIDFGWFVFNNFCSVFLMILIIKFIIFKWYSIVISDEKKIIIGSMLKVKIKVIDLLLIGLNKKLIFF